MNPRFAHVPQHAAALFDRLFEGKNDRKEKTENSTKQTSKIVSQMKMNWYLPTVNVLYEMHRAEQFA